MLSQHIPLCVGGSLGKDGHVSELPPVVVVPGGVGTRVHSTTKVELGDNRYGSSNRRVNTYYSTL